MALTLDGTNGIVSSGSITTQSATGVIFSDSSSLPAASSPYVLKNRIINGAMVISQRNGTTATTTADDYPVDRFQIANNSAATFSAVQSTTAPAGFNNSFYFNVTSADSSVTGADRTFIRQRIEGYNIADLGWGTASAKTITLSAQVYSSVTGTFGGAILNNAEDRSYAFTYSIPVANTWTSISVTIAGDTTGTWLTTNSRGMNVLFSLGMGSSLTTAAGSWTAGQYYSATGCTNLISTNGATFYITGVQLEIGTTATPFELRLYNQELANCQRYLPAFNSTGTLSPLGTAYSQSATSVRGLFQFQVPPRVAPTGITNTTASQFVCVCGAHALAASALSFTYGSQNMATIDFTSSGFTTGQSGFIYANNSSAQILFTGCEL